MKTIIETKNLVKNYDNIDRVKNIDLDIKKGEIYGFLGPNGAGKSTTMKMLLGLVQPTSGDIKIFGKDLKKNKREILLKTGNIIENPSYYGHLTGLENMSIIETLLGLPKGSGKEALKIVSLEEDMDKKVSDYSLGMKQRLAIAMALVRKPELLILDEPTNGLDPAGTKEIRDLITRLAREYGITIMISSHLLSEIEKIADHVGIIKDGEMIFQGRLSELDKYKRSNTIIRTSSNSKAMKILEKLRPEIQEENLVIKNISPKQRAQIVKHLIKNDLDVYLISEEKTNLEDIFLNLTESR